MIAAAAKSAWFQPRPWRPAWDVCWSGCERWGAPGCSWVGCRRGSIRRCAGPGVGIGVGMGSGGCGGDEVAACSASQLGLWQGWWPRPKAPGQDRQHGPRGNRARRVHRRAAAGSGGVGWEWEWWWRCRRARVRSLGGAGPRNHRTHPRSRFFISGPRNFHRQKSRGSLGLVDLSRTPSGTFFAFLGAPFLANG